MLARARKAAKDPRARWYALALVVGFGIRLWWVIRTTGTEPIANEDNRVYIDWARQLASFQSPRVNGQLTAFYSPGYAFFLVPITWLSRAGVFSVEFGGALANVGLSMVIIWGTARLAADWVGPKARNPAAWLMALAPPFIYLTSVTLSENLYATLIVVNVVLVSNWFRPGAKERRPSWELLAVGLLLGFNFLVRNEAIAQLPVVLVGAWLATRSGKALRRTTALVVIGMVLVMGPWMYRNGEAIGFWSPSGTANAADMCLGNSPHASGTYIQGPEIVDRCYWGVKHLEPKAYPDAKPGREAEFFRKTWLKAANYIVTHPVDEVRLAAWKMYWDFGQDRYIGTLGQTGRTDRVSQRYLELAQNLSDGWRWLVMGTGVLGLVRIRRLRRAVPLLLGFAGLLAIRIVGPAGGRGSIPVLPFLCIFAVAAWLSMRDSDDDPPRAVVPRAPEPTFPDGPAQPWY